MLDKPSILIIDDDPGILESHRLTFSLDYEVLTVSSGPEGIELLRQRSDIYCVILDIRMPGMDGVETAEGIRAVNATVPIIAYTAYPGQYGEAEISRQFHPLRYIIKGEDPTILRDTVSQAFGMQGLLYHPHRLVGIARDEFGLTGNSQPMLKLYREILRIAPVFRRCLILGERGTGKELVARALHRRSNRHNEPLRVRNSSAIEVGFSKEELFGVVKNAFQGAEEVAGLFEQAHGGVAFLDEITDLNVQTQPELLRFLDDGTFTRLGSSVPRHADVCIITASNRDIREMMDLGEFRRDLFDRLTEYVIDVPPLRERREDIPDLIDHFARQACDEFGYPPIQLAQDAYHLLMQHDWPDNVRGLQNVVKQLATRSGPFPHIPTDFVEEALGRKAPSITGRSTYQEDLDELEKNYCLWGLRYYGTLSEFARQKKWDPSNLRRTLRKHGIDQSQSDL